MSVEYCIQSTRYAAHAAGFHLLYIEVDLDFVEKATRILMYARHRRSPTLLQFPACKGIVGDDTGTPCEIDLILNVDERMRLFLSTRDPGYDIETIRFNLEELAFPWLLKQREHTICSSRHFFESYGFPRETWRAYPRSKDVLSACYVPDCSCKAEATAQESKPN